MAIPDLTLGAGSGTACRSIANPLKAKSTANRGAAAEAKVKQALQAWAAAAPHREFNRLTDTKAARRIVKAAPADFDFYVRIGSHTVHGLIEVKETRHEYRLAHDKVPQLPRMARRADCGGLCFVLVFHSLTKYWRCLDVTHMANDQKGASWDLRHTPAHCSPYEALSASLPEIFP